MNKILSVVTLLVAVAFSPSPSVAGDGPHDWSQIKALHEMGVNYEYIGDFMQFAFKKGEKAGLSRASRTWAEMAATVARYHRGREAEKVFRNLGITFEKLSRSSKREEEIKLLESIALDIWSLSGASYALWRGAVLGAQSAQQKQTPLFFYEAHDQLYKAAKTLWDQIPKSSSRDPIPYAKLASSALMIKKAGFKMRRGSMALKAVSLWPWSNTCKCGTIFKRGTKDQKICVIEEGYVCDTCEWESNEKEAVKNLLANGAFDTLERLGNKAKIATALLQLVGNTKSSKRCIKKLFEEIEELLGADDNDRLLEANDVIAQYKKCMGISSRLSTVNLGADKLEKKVADMPEKQRLRLRNGVLEAIKKM